MKISLGAGTLIEPGWTHVDIVRLPGIDVVHDLDQRPWPFNDNSATNIKALDILEHIEKVVPFIDECYRILETGGVLYIRTPRYDADFLWIDPEHKRGFHERSMDFFSKTTDFGKSTGFYSKADFDVNCEVLQNKNLIFTMVKL